MKVIQMKFGWNKALLTVALVAFVLWLLDYSIHVHFHSDISAGTGKLPAPIHDEDSHHEAQPFKEPRYPPKYGAAQYQDDFMDEDRDTRQKGQAPFELPNNPFAPLKDRPAVAREKPMKDVGFRRNQQGKLVFAPDAVWKDNNIDIDDEDEDENREMKPPRDPRKPGKIQKESAKMSKEKKRNNQLQNVPKVGPDKGQEQKPVKPPVAKKEPVQLGGLTEEEKEAKKQRQTLLDRLEDLYGRVKKAKGFDDEGNFQSQGDDEITECDEMTRPTAGEIEIQNEQWQIMDGLQHDVYLHTAYLDSRPAFDDTPSIRTMLVISGYFFHGRAHCLFWYKGQNKPINVPTTSIDRLSFLRKHFVNNVQYSMYMFSCTIPQGMGIPDQVSMVMNPCESPSNLLPVTHPYGNEVKHDFAVCVIGQWAQIGDIEAAFLTEWIEAYGMFGVGEINIYNVSLKVTPMVQDVIDHYTKLGRLRIVHQTAPVTATNLEDEYDASQLCLRTSANDCLLRNVNRYNHIFVIDRDEVMVPRKHKTYGEMRDYWFQNFQDFDKAPAITVQNSFFYMDFDPDETQLPYLATLRYRSRQPPEMPNPEHKYIPGKSMVNTKYCKIAWNHNCQIPFEPKQLAPMNTALLHHYRRGCLVASRAKDKGLKEKECEWIRYRESEDDYMLKFKEPLQQRVDHAFKKIGLNSTYLTQLLKAGPMK